MLNKPREECGVFAVYSKETTDVASMAYFALYALQHRGQESCGIVVNDKGVLSHHKDLGLVPEVFTQEKLDKLGTGNIAIGHVRYSTTGKPNRSNAQPIVVRHVKGPMSIAHNGNLVNAHKLREKYEMRGAIFHTTNDTEVIAYAITEQRLKRASIEEAVEYAMADLQGAYSLVVMSPKKLIAARDPQGFRPLCMGRCKDGAVVFASETCALDSVGATFEREVEPGEIVVVDGDDIHSIRTYCGQKQSFCVFEYIYFARPDSMIDHYYVHDARVNAGKILWREHPVEADVVIGVPDSGLDAAIGFSEASGIPYNLGFMKNRYIGRTFIQPTQAMRDRSVRLKLSPVSSVVKGKSIVMIDDSIVRGTTSRRIVQLLKDAGATQVHVRIASPVITSPCFYGVDTSTKDQLIGARLSVDEICDYIHADSLRFMSEEEVKEAAGNIGLCLACFNGEYCTKLFSYQKELDK